MRTTLDIPEDLLKRAKIEAVQRGTTLRELVGAALERELAAASRASLAPRRAQWRGSNRGTRSPPLRSAGFRRWVH